MTASQRAVGIWLDETGHANLHPPLKIVGVYPWEHQAIAKVTVDIYSGNITRQLYVGIVQVV